MKKSNTLSVTAYLKDGTTMEASYIDRCSGTMWEFDLNVKGKRVEFLYIETNPEDRKWLERDYKADKKEHCDGHYKKARFEFDRLEIHRILR